MNKVSFWKTSLAILASVNVFLVCFFLWKTGMQAYVIISAVVTLGWLRFILMVLKHGYMLGRRAVISKGDNATKFYANVAFLVAGYLLMLLFSFGLYLQKTGYLAH